MPRPAVARACALLALAATLAGACGSDGDNASSTTTTTTGADAPASSITTGAVSTAAPTTTTDALTRTIELTYAAGQVTGGVRTVSVAVGAMVVVRITSDVDEEVHVHTYDAVADVTAGQTAELRLQATIPGRFEVELEKKGKQVLVLEVK